MDPNPPASDRALELAALEPEAAVLLDVLPMAGPACIHAHPPDALLRPCPPLAPQVEPQRVQELLAFVTLFKQGSVSASSQELLHRLRQLGPAEGLASIGAFADLLVGQAEPSSLPFVARFLEDVAALAAAGAQAALQRHVSLAGS